MSTKCRGARHCNFQRFMLQWGKRLPHPLRICGAALDAKEGRGMQLPSDGAMLASFLNTKLRDGYRSLEALCDDLELDLEALLARLAALGLVYDAAHNCVR